MKRMILAVLFGMVLALASPVHAGEIILDRGLPTTNLNNVSGGDRSNVAWAFTQYTTDNYWLVGDTFTNTTSSLWTIDNIRLWTTGPTDTAILLGGIDGSGTLSSTSGAMTSVTYSNGATYETGTLGVYRDIYQVDFAVNITLAPGQTYRFFLDGSGNTRPDVYVPFLHASNGALSGSAQQGSDDSMLYANVLNGVLDQSSIGTWSSMGDGWDKASDVNVQVFGTVPDGGMTLTLLGCALVGVGALRRRFRG